jgi:ZIP family zinc transporter
MVQTLTDVILYALGPVATAITGALIATVRPPGAAVRSAFQHFAAGVVLSVVAVELLPDVVRQHKPVPVVVGFVLGIGALLILRSFAPSEESLSRRSGRIPLVFLSTVGVDVLIDGFLIGIGFAAGAKEGKILALALSVELLSLGLATVLTLLEAAVPRIKAVLITSGGASLILVGAVLGATLLRNLSHTSMEVLLSFGLAALMFLVVEELLVEAHKVQETPLITSSFFAGFLLFLVIGMTV